MGPLLIFLLSWHQLYSLTQSEVLGSAKNGIDALMPNGLSDSEEDRYNELVPPEISDEASISDNAPNNIADVVDGDEMPFVRAGHDQTEVEFRHPIAAVNIDYSKNMIMLKFRKDQYGKGHRKIRSDEEKRRALDSNFMRFGRSPTDFMRFGKRQVEQMPIFDAVENDSNEKGRYRPERSNYENYGMRDPRGDNFMRFGRASNGQDFMRFGRPANDFMRFGRTAANSNFMRFGRIPNAQDYMRFGRSPADFMRFGRTNADNFMRFGRLPGQDFMRFGRNRYADNNFLRFGRPDNFMRFGRSPQNSGTDQSGNFMRFGKSNTGGSLQNQTNGAQQQKHDIRETAKLMHQTQKDGDENPMDKAIQVLFNEQQRKDQDSKEQQSQQQIHGKSSEDDVDDTDLDEAFNLNK